MKHYMTLNFSCIVFGLILLTSCDERLDEQVVRDHEIEVRWWTTSAISSSQGHVEVVKGKEVRPIARWFHGGARHVVIREDSIILTKGGVGVLDFVVDSVFGYKVVLDIVP